MPLCRQHGETNSNPKGRKYTNGITKFSRKKVTHNSPREDEMRVRQSRRAYVTRAAGVGGVLGNVCAQEAEPGDAVGDEKLASRATELLRTGTGVATATASSVAPTGGVSAAPGEGEGDDVSGGEDARRGAGDDTEDRAVLTTGLSDAAHGDAPAGGGVPSPGVAATLDRVPVAGRADMVSSEKQLSDTEPSPSASPSPV
ncbi:Duffy receptor alpha form [Frankliniella fusca]|uniref:Duffy receptor alpha form n=1 Tax=Frankliniella fusca TaxID=407009 RepID=A0AAE1L8Q4_9NEOP|nr:Duffy receptor alpha form [Frankliniella fusca]